MWSEADVQRKRIADEAMEVSSYFYKNDTLRIDQSLRRIGMCLPSLLSFSAPLIEWPEKDIKTLTAIWIQAYTNAWNLGKSTASSLFIFAPEFGELSCKLPLATIVHSMWGNLDRCCQFDDGTRQVMEVTFHEALTQNGCANLLELQQAAKLVTWKVASKNEFTFACHLIQKVDIQVL